MIRAYHVIWGTYGFWLPNDPRGSWSDFVASWELARFGKAPRPRGPKPYDPKQPKAWRDAAIKTLTFPPARLTGVQAHAVGVGFGNAARKSGLTVWACSILPQHVHLVVARHRLRIEQICILLKGGATKQLKAESRHPYSHFASGSKLPSLWGERQWKVFLDTDDAIRRAVEYVEQNPVKAGKRRQRWSFVAQFPADSV
jgi:REP element-mobilizing transposase RayT